MREGRESSIVIVSYPSTNSEKVSDEERLQVSPNQGTCVLRLGILVKACIVFNASNAREKQRP